MEPENQIGTVVTKRRWQLRWGHILLAIFLVVLVVIAYIVIQEIKTADRNSQACLTTNSCSNGAGKKTTGSNKTPVSAGSKPSNKSSQPPTPSSNNAKTPQSPATTNSSNSPSTSTSTNTTSTNSSNSPALANTGPGNTIGIFVGVTITGTMFHYFYTKRRLGFTK